MLATAVCRFSLSFSLSKTSAGCSSAQKDPYYIINQPNL